MKPSDVVRYTIALAGAVERRRLAMREQGDARRPNAELARLIDFLAAQPAFLVYTIAVLMVVGRHDLEGDFDFFAHYLKASDALPSLRKGIKDLAELSHLVNNLQDGWRLFQAHGYDLDDIMSGNDPWAC